MVLEKMLKKMKVWIVILLVVFLSLIAFWGVFQKESGVWNNVIPNYTLGMDVKGARELRYTLDNQEEEKYVYVDENGEIKGEVWEDGSATTAEHEAEHEAGTAEDEHEAEDLPYNKETRTIKANRDDQLTKENFEQAKKIIQDRLKKQGISEYYIRIDDVTGKLVVETKDDNGQVQNVQELISNTGKFQMVDYQNGLILMDNSDIKKASVVTSNESGYSTYLQIDFNQEGTQKLKDISNKYVETKVVEEENETQEETQTEEAEDTEEEEETEKKYVSIVFDDTTMMTTYFGEEMSSGMMQIPVGQNRTDYDEYTKDYDSAQLICDVLNSGIMPITYTLESDNFVESEVVSQIETLKMIAIGLVAIASILFVVKFKMNGLLASILGVGYIALLSLIVRYTNAMVTQSSFVAYFVVILLNYVGMKEMLQSLQNNSSERSYNETTRKFYLSLIPMCVVAIVFTLSNYFVVSSIGMALFWGLILNIGYHFVVTKTVFEK